MSQQTQRANPYVGPRAFRYGERLYGRDREVMQLLDLLIAERIVLLLSPSGAGKTSLIQAALLPELEREAFAPLPIMRVNQAVPADQQPHSRFNRYTFSALLSLEEALPAEKQLPVDELARLSLQAYLAQRWSTDEVANTVLIFDQFEEVLTVDPTNQAAKASFFEQLGAALRDRDRWALFSMREDYVAGLDQYLRPIPTRLSTSFRLDLLRTDSARMAMQQPARSAHVDFTDAAADRLLDDLRRVRVQRADGTTEERLGPYVEPVQLQVVCLRLWENLLPDATTIVEADVEALGNVDDALAGYYADQVHGIAILTGVSERAIRDWVDQHLITEQGIRGQVLHEPTRSEGLENEAIWALVNAHLVRAEERRGAWWFELSHDRLIEPLRANNATWRTTNLSTLQRQAALWDRAERPNGLLLHDDALREAERWANDHRAELTPIEEKFLCESREARALAERERRQARRLRLLAIVASAVSVVALLAFVVAVVFFIRAERQQRVALSRELAAQSISNLEIDPERSVVLALHAVSTDMNSETDAALQRAVQAARAQRTLQGHTNRVNDVAYSADGTRVASGSADGTARIWDAATGALVLTIPTRSGWVHDVVFSPDGTQLITANGDGTAQVWDARSGTLVHMLSGHRDVVFGVAVSLDGTRIATASWDKTAKVWDAASGDDVLTLDHHTGHVKGVAFSPDGIHLATVSDDETAKLWDVRSGTVLRTLTGHTSALYGVAFSRDGKYLATASDDKTARIWDVASGKVLHILTGHTQSVHGVAFSPDDAQMATASVDGTIKIWDVNTGAPLLTLAGHSNPVDGVAYSPDGLHIASASRDRSAKIWNAVVGHTAAVTGVAFSPDGTLLATSSDDHTAKLWDAASRNVIRTLGGHEDRVKDVAFSPDGARLVTASDDRTAKVWDVASGRELFPLEGHSDNVTVVAYSPDGARIATAGVDRTAIVWDAVGGAQLRVLPGHTDWINGVAFTPDSARVVTASGDGTTRVWDARSGEELLRISSGRARGVAVSLDGTYIATAGDDGMATIWNAVTGEHVRTLPGHSNVVHGVAFSRDGTRIATASWDKTAVVWDAHTGKRLTTLHHTAEVYRVAFSPDGNHLATASTDNLVNIYILPIKDLMARARTHVTRALTLGECQAYLHQPSCPPLP
jgi:WD40 repeat protein